MSSPLEIGKSLPQIQEYRFLHPDAFISEDFRAVYLRNQVEIGWPLGVARIYEHLARPHTGMIIGAELGDEGKGRFIDNKIGGMLMVRGVEIVVVDRFQGGNNSGHSVEANGEHLALHQVPSGVMYQEAVGIMDRGMTINPVDLVGEIATVEQVVGDIRGKLFLSRDAVLNTDLDRAEEQLNRKKQGKAGGGTGRGIAPSYAHHYDRLGFHISDLMENDWREKLGQQYDRYEKEFGLYGLPLAYLDVPDFVETKRTGKEQKRKVGGREEFLDRLESARVEIIARDMVRNTYIMHRSIYSDLTRGVLFEGAQALGLHAWLGTLPDITASDTSGFGIASGTAFWNAHQVEDRIGVFKVPYTSSVGARRMPTHAEDEWSVRVRDKAHEFGTTTGRPRDILYPDLALLAYNIRMAGIEVLAGTHLDIAWEDVPIWVCTHYTNAEGDIFPYQPGLIYQRGVIPRYIELPGWDGEAVARAGNFDELPVNAKRFLAFVQRRLGMPIVAVTTGPARNNYIDILPG